MKKVSVKRFLVLFTIMALSIVMSFCALATDTSFEEEIKNFPESYKPYLRSLHEKYPDWTFVPMLTGLDWETVIDNEISKPTNNKNDKKSLVAAGSAVSDIFKSTSSYDYNQSTGVFKQWDSGFVASNRLAVSYFMDPRNFLSEDNIFQFELLAFDERHTIEAIENVLNGSFMSQTKITYYDSEGNKKSINKTYSEAILQAGEKYNINPCYLASKILNEVGSSGSSSVTGKHSEYPGIYNFYNIGATDGAGAIARGLQWASSGTTYSRPWDTPVKSIDGGAEYLAATYIKNGQFTGYLQRFNVNPDAYYNLYTHQYMTNLTGALSQGYSTYLSYAKSGLLYNNYVFSIPVYENMPEGDGASAYAADSINQKGKINVSSSNVRTGPSTYYAKLLDSSGNAVLLSKNTVVNILEKFETDTDYYGSILMYPYWYKVSFTYNSKTMTGYVPAGFVDISTKTTVPTGEYDLTFIKSDENAKLSLMSMNDSVIQVVDSDTVKFLKSGSATLIAYDSLGKLDKILFKVTATPSVSPVSDFEAATGSKKATVTFSKNSAVKTELTISKYNGELVKTVSTDDSTYTFKSLTPAAKYTVTARAMGSDEYSVAKAVSFAVPPEKVTSLKYNTDSNGNTVLSWKAIDCTGYAVYCYDSETEKYTRMASVRGKTTYTVPDEYENMGTYCVRAYISFDGKNTYGSLSDLLTTKVTPATPNNVTVSNQSESGYKLSWSKADKAEGYCVYRVDGEKLTLVETLNETSLAFTALNSGSASTYKIRAYFTQNGEKVYSEYTDAIVAITKPKAVTSLKRSGLLFNGVTLSWKASSGASEYEIYAESANSKKTLVATTDKLEYAVTGLVQNTKYTFSVVAITKVDEASASSKESKIEVTTYLSLVQSLKISASDVTTATLSWSKNKEAAGYEVYLYNSSSKEYEYFDTVTVNSIILTDLVPGTNYYYKVRCVGEKVDGTANYSKFSSKLKVVTKVPKFETHFKVSSVASTSFKLSWTAADDVYSYNVYRYENGAYKKLAGTTKTSYKVSGLKESHLASYAVSAVYKFGSVKVESEKSELFSASTKPSKVKNLTATASPNGVTLKWNSVPNASFYRVYLYNFDKGKYVAQKDVTKTTCTLSSLGYANDQRVRIRVYLESDAGTVYSGLTQVNFTTLPKNISTVKLSSATETTQTLKWSTSTGATHYYVYRYDESSNSYKRIAITDKKNYKVSKLKSGVSYKYKIRPVVMKNGKTVLYGNSTKAYKFSTIG